MDVYKPHKPNFQKAYPKSQLDLNKMGEMSASNLLSSKKGINKAAKLLLTLGPEQAANILKQLDETEVEKLMKEMANIERVKPEERNAILKEFEEQLGADSLTVKGGISEARKFLQASLGVEATEEMLKRINKRDLHLDFAFLETVDPQALSSVLENEHSQVVAVAMAYLKPKTAAEVFKNFSPEFRSDVAMRLAKSAKIHPDAIQKVAEVLRNKFEKRDTESYAEVGGVRTLAQILNYMGRKDENEILEELEIKTPEMIQSVKEHLYTIEELIHLTNKEMRLLISNIRDDLLIASALRGIQQDLRLHFFNSMSQNRAANILDEIERRGPLHVKEINEARAQIIGIARLLENDGLICIKKEKEEEEYI